MEHIFADFVLSNSQNNSNFYSYCSFLVRFLQMYFFMLTFLQCCQIKKQIYIFILISSIYFTFLKNYLIKLYLLIDQGRKKNLIHNAIRSINNSNFQFSNIKICPNRIKKENHCFHGKFRSQSRKATLHHSYSFFINY